MPVAERVPDAVHRRRVRVVGLGRDELGEGERAGFRLGRREGRVIRLADLVVEPLRRAGLDEPSDVERAAELAHDGAKSQPRLARRPAAADPGVENDEPLDPLRVLDREAQPDRAAPVVHHECQLRQVELLDEPCDRVDVAVVRVPADLGRLVRAAEADQVRRDLAPGQLRDDVPPQKRRRRLAVQQQRRLAVAFVDVVQPASVELEPVRGEGLDQVILEENGPDGLRPTVRPKLE